MEEDRWEILRRVESWLETPLIVLGLVWLAIFLVELLWGDHPALRVTAGVIWIVFIADFLIRFVLAPRKLAYLRASWITVIALGLPALRVLRLGRVIRALRAARGIQLARLVTSVNRGMGALGRSMQRRGLPYVVALTAIMLLAGAAGMFAFEHPSHPGGFRSYGESLWWTAMLLTTIGSEHWPATAEGRALALLLSVYSLGVLGYITGSLASFFVGRDAESHAGEIAGEATLQTLRAELAALREELRTRGPGGA